MARKHQLNHANYFMGAIKAIEELVLELFSIINGLRLKISVPIEGITFKRAHKLFDHEVVIGAGIVVGFHDVGNMLARISFVI